MAPEPKTLQQAIQYFSDPDNCHNFLAIRRFPDGVMCPRCGSKEVSFIKTRRIWECKTKHPKRQFSAKINTVFEDSPIGLDKWLMVVWMIANCKNGISSYEIAKAIGVTQKSAWFMLHRVRVAMRVGAHHKLGDGPEGEHEVEVDETFVGGRVKNMHADRKLKLQQLRDEVVRPDHYMGKTVVMGMLDRTLREVRAKVIPNVRRDILQSEILRQIKLGSKVYTDEHTGYMGLPHKYAHGVVNHLETYVRGCVHTNGIENFWSLLKRSLRGTYVAVEPFHLEKYVDEQAFRYNNRATKKNPMTDADRFDKALRNIVGKRITYKELTGKEEQW
jgi:ISXO2-like transposase domain/Transposase zinc-ribbon domain